MVASPHAYGRSGSAAASATPAARPTECRPRWTPRRAGRRPRATERRADAAERLHLEHDDVRRTGRRGPAAGPRPSGSTHRRPAGRRQAGAARPSPQGSRTAAPRTPARTPASSRSTACLADVPAAIGVNPDRAIRTERVAHRLDPLDVGGAGWPGSATFTFAVRQPDAGHDLPARSARRRHGHVDRDPVPDRRRPRRRGGLERAGEPPRALVRPVLGNGENSPQPAGPGTGRPRER